MSTLSVSSLQNTASPVVNIGLNTDGSSTLALYNLGLAPTPVVTGTLWYDVSGAGLVIWDGAAWVSAGAPTAALGLNLTGNNLKVSIPVALTPPAPGPGVAQAIDGSMYWDSTLGQLFIRYNDGFTTQWVAAAPPGGGSTLVAATNAEARTGTSTTVYSSPATSVPKDASGMTGAAILPSGTGAQRPATPAVGMTRVNTTTNSPEAYVNGAWSPIQSTQSGQFAGFRNILINGNFAINQRAYVSGTATTVANQYTLDRWKVLTSGQNLAFAASGNGNQITAPAGGVQQVIEDVNVGGGTYTLSWTGTATAQVNGSAVANGGQVTLPANTQATVTFTGGTVSQAQLEPGGVASPFEQRGITTELALCQRYYEENATTIPNFTVPAFFTQYKVNKRVAPTVTNLGPGAAVSSLPGGFAANQTTAGLLGFIADAEI